MVLALCLTFVNAYCQVFNNNTRVYVVKGTSVYVKGSTTNTTNGIINLVDSCEIITDDYVNNGTSQGNGNYKLFGNWLNNNIFLAGTSTVYLQGNLQQIGGGTASYFYNLLLTGTGPKSQAINQYVSHTLDLTDKELKTDSFSMFVLNPNISAIQRTSGFVSSLGDGFLARTTADTTAYLFPVGSSIGTTLYRPVEIKPVDSDTNVFSVRMAHADATAEGYDRTLHHTDICNTHAPFYHRINRISGSSPAGMSVYFDPLVDGSWDGLAHWTSTQWDVVAGSNVLPASPFSQAHINNWNDFSQTPYILYQKNNSIDLGNDTLLCAGASLVLNAGTGFSSYFWNTGDTLPAITVTTTGTYAVTVTSGACAAVDSVVVTFTPPVTLALGNDTLVCSGDSLYLDAGPGFSSYLWNTGDTTQYLSVSSSGSYDIMVADIFGCPGFDTIGITVNAYNAAIDYVDTLCDDGPVVNLTAADSGGVWSGKGIIDANLGLFDPVLAGIGTHTITYMISLPCGDTATINIVVDDCEPVKPHAVVPDIFSPNGDGENDILYVRGEGIKTLYFAVYTRWGEKVFDTVDKRIGWDGTFKDKPLDPAVFVYYLIVNFENNEELNIKGDVTLVR